MPTLVDIDRKRGRARLTGPVPEADVLAPVEAWQPGASRGLLLAVDSEPEARFTDAPVIGIDFPTFFDGRGLSLAVLLRTRFDYQGELRAVGDVHPELLHYLCRCGFDSCVLPEGRHLPGDDVPLAPYSDYYQSSVIEAEPAFRRRQRG
jgi:uncharacterized protein (DUF934 family)